MDNADLDGLVERRIADLYANDVQFRNATSLRPAQPEPGRAFTQILAAAMSDYADRPALGERAAEAVTDPATGDTSLRLLPEFRTTSYGELWSRVGAVTADWHHHGDHPLRAGEFVCIMGFASGDFTTIDLACVRIGAVSVVLPSGAPADRLRSIIDETAARILAASIDQLAAAAEAAIGSPSIRRLLVFDYRDEVGEHRAKLDAARRRLADAGSALVIDPLAQVIGRGSALPPAPDFGSTPDDQRLATVIYTSGSTGTPKGAMYTHQLIRSLWTDFWPFAKGLPIIGITYLPMSHAMGRAVLMATLVSGGTQYVTARSDLSTLLEDIALVRPTELLLVPRVCELLLQLYQGELERHGATAVADVADVRSALWEKALGGRIVRAASGSAPLSAEMAEFIQSLLQIRLRNGYGSTETGNVIFDGKVLRPSVIDYKLIDVPELGYFRTDTPHPRGELLIRSETLIAGYYKHPEIRIVDEDGYYRTGDIMAEAGPDELVYVDRRNNVQKLSNGEFVAISRLEVTFARSPLVGQIYLYGNSRRAYLLAVVVPTPEAIAQARSSGEDLKTSIGASLRRLAEDADLNPYEIPRDLLIETTPFSTGNGLLSELRKPVRRKLKETYGERLERLYTELAEQEARELRQLRQDGHRGPVIDTVMRLAQALVTGPGSAPTPGLRFTELGGDSLSALSYARLLSEITGVTVPVGVIVSPANDLQRIADHITGLLKSGTQQATFTSVHGDGRSRVHVGDLALHKMIDATTLAAAASLPRPGGPVRTVLLTGANGYLGRFLCLEWLERAARADGTVICVVRGSTAEEARKRLDNAFDSGDPELLRRFRDLAREHLEVLAGDFAEPALGLDEPTWDRLADSVDLIVHAGAFVNHVLPYDQLFGPNVVGTAELIRLALTRRVKRFDYLSTAAVVAVEPTAVAEDSDIRVAIPARPLDDSYANGYTTSKWAGEVLLREAHEKAGLPVVVYRPGMILAHSRYAGQLNLPDMFTRLLISLISTGVAPRSFQPLDAAGNRPAAHYDGLPVDFVAEAVAGLSERVREGCHAFHTFHTFNVVNPHDDGVSLDVFVDWLIDAGFPIKRIDGYDDWFARLETSIRTMPQRQKQHSLLPLLHAFAEPGKAFRGAGVAADDFRAAVRDTGGDIPQITVDLIRKYVADLRALKLIH